MQPSQVQNGKCVWIRETEHAPWSPRDSMGHVVYRDKMWLLGGFTPERVNDVWCSSDGKAWRLVTPSAAWKPRNLPGVAVHKARMWVMGGNSGRQPGERGETYNDVWCSTDGERWDLVTEHAPWTGRSAAPVVVFHDRMWILGGMTADFVHFNDVWCSEDGMRWEEVASGAPWRRRAMHTSVVFDGKLWVMGGGIYDDAYPLNTVEDYNDVWCSDDGEHWEQVTAAAPWCARRFHRSVVFRGKIWLLAGFARRNLNDVWYSSDGRAWHPAAEHAEWSIRHEPACLVLADRIWLLGGYERGDALYNDVWWTAGDVPAADNR